VEALTEAVSAEVVIPAVAAALFAASEGLADTDADTDGFADVVAGAFFPVSKATSKGRVLYSPQPRRPILMRSRHYLQKRQNPNSPSPHSNPT
jgi:hypothetical protein